MKRALVVDDSRTGRLILCRILEDAGFSIEEASNGALALERLANEPRPDLLLIDWNMPVMSGIELVESIRAQRELDSIRLMMVTTETDYRQVERAMRAGVDAYAMKPCTGQVVLGNLRSLGFELPDCGSITPGEGPADTGGS